MKLPAASGRGIKPELRNKKRQKAWKKNFKDRKKDKSVKNEDLTPMSFPRLKK